MSLLALIAEPSIPVSATLRKYLEGAGFAVKVVKTPEDALAQAQAKDASPSILFAGVSDVFDGAQVCFQVKQALPQCPAVLVYPPDVEDPEPDAARAGADAYLVGPLKRGTVVSCAKTMMRVRALLEQVERLESDLKKTTAETRKPEGEGSGAFSDFDFFKRLLLMEVKRSRRYRYPVAFLLVGLDRITERLQNLSPLERTKALTEALRIVSKAVRDIDLAVPFSEGRYLVFLPHTPRDGAQVVATRIRERLAKMEALPEATASVGVAAYEPGHAEAPQVSFGGLMKDATEALRKAQAAGGDRVELSGSGDKGKRDRISLT